MTENFGIILDSLVIILLMATIVYAAILSRRLTQLRRHRKDLDGAIRTLAEAAARADNGVRALKQTAEETGARLQSQIDRANALRDELAMLLDAGESKAEQLGVAELPSVPRTNVGAANDMLPDVDETDLDPDAAEAARRRALPGKSGMIRAPARDLDPERRGARDDRAAAPDQDLMKVIDNMR